MIRIGSKGRKGLTYFSDERQERAARLKDLVSGHGNDGFRNGKMDGKMKSSVNRKRQD